MTVPITTAGDLEDRLLKAARKLQKVPYGMGLLNKLVVHAESLLDYRKPRHQKKGSGSFQVGKGGSVLDRYRSGS